MNYAWLLFDLDDTLFNFQGAQHEAFFVTLEEMFLPVEEKTFEAYRRINGDLWDLLEKGRITAKDLQTRRFSLLLDELGAERDAEAMGRRYLANLGRRPELIPGAAEVVPRLAEHVQLMMITNGLKDVQRPRLAASPLKSYFPEMVISEEVGVAKPHAAIFEEAFRRMGHPAKDSVLIIGDSLSSDIRGGVDFGIDTCWFNPHGRPAQDDLQSRFEIRSLDQLFAVVGLDVAVA